MAKQQLTTAESLAIIQQALIEFEDSGGQVMITRTENDTVLNVAIHGARLSEAGWLEAVETPPPAVCEICGQDMHIIQKNGAYGPFVYFLCNVCPSARGHYHGHYGASNSG